MLPALVHALSLAAAAETHLLSARSASHHNRSVAPSLSHDELAPRSHVTRRLAVINVQPGVDTLWQALDAANAGDELVLADGTYTAQNVIVGKPMTIRELNAHGAILDGQGTSRVVS